MSILQRSSRLLLDEAEIASAEIALMTSNIASPNLDKLQEAARTVRKLARKAEAAAASGSPHQYPQLVLLQADIAWRMSNKDLAILLYQQAGEAFGSLHLTPLKVISSLIVLHDF